MNEIYLIITGGVILYTLLQLVTGAVSYDSSELRGVSTIIIGGVGIFMLFFSAILIFGEYIEVTPATNTQVGNELIIQAEGWPTQVVDRISLIDQNVQIKKITTHNAWGGKMQTTYEVESIKTEIQ